MVLVGFRDEWQAVSRGLRGGALQREGEVQVQGLQEVVRLLAGPGRAPAEGARGIGVGGVLEGPGGGAVMGWHECEGVLELVLVRMKRCATAEECRGAVEEVLALVKERKLERLREELGVIG